MKLLLPLLFLTTFVTFGQFAPSAGIPGTTAIYKDSSAIVEWATEVVTFTRGLEDIENPDGPLASFGVESAALGYAEGNSADVVSLGDMGSITLGFEYSFQNGPGHDFLVFENSFSDDYLELAHVEVSSDGERFVRIPSISNTQTEEQAGPFDNTDATEIHNLAGKYRQGYGTPFDLEDIADSTGIDLMDVKYVRVVDVVGTINPEYGTFDSEGNIINDPYKTDFESGGFDLDAVGIINSNNPSLSTNEIAIQSVVVYPNPTKGALSIRTNANIKQVNLIDEIGRIVYQGTDTILDLEQLGINAGIYILRLIDEENNIHQERISFID